MSVELTDEQRINALLTEDERQPWDIDTWGIAETLVAEDVNAGKYEGCSSELEMAFQAYETLTKEILEKKERGVNYCPGDCGSFIRRARAKEKHPKCKICETEIKFIRKPIVGVPDAWEWEKV